MIRLEGIVQTYPGPQGPVQALRGIDLEVAPGEVFGIIGRSGAGKSSLVRTINLLNRPSAGRVWVAGQELTALSASALRQARHGIGMIFQHFNLLSSRTVYGNVALPLELAGLGAAEIRRRVQPLLELVGLAELHARYPAQISGGQKQRVGIARALANRSRVLLSDEATSALDPETTRAVLALLRRINRELDLTVVLVTHQMLALKQIADRVAVIDAGRIVEQGPVLQMLTQPQHATTRSLVEEVAPQTLPASVWARVQALLDADCARDARALQLSFAGAVADRALLSDAIHRHGLDLTLVHGQVDEVQGQAFGLLTVVLRGEGTAIEAAIAQWHRAGIQVQVLSQASGRMAAPAPAAEAVDVD